MPKGPIKIGIILTELNGLDTKALKYLILYQNSIQSSFEFQFLSLLPDHDLINTLNLNEPVSREYVENQAKVFFNDCNDHLIKQAENYELLSPKNA